MIKAYSGRVNPKDFLAGVDDLFGNVLGPRKGRNIIYSSFGIIPYGLSEGHDQFIEGNCFSINIKQLTRDLGEGCRLAVIEIPTDDYRKPLSVETNYEGCKDWLERDLVSANWDPVKSEGFTFGNIPHLAIWTAEGKIPPKYLNLI